MMISHAPNQTVARALYLLAHTTKQNHQLEPQLTQAFYVQGKPDKSFVLCLLCEAKETIGLHASFFDST